MLKKIIDRDELLTVKDLKAYFYVGKEIVKAVDGVSFSIKEGETLGIAGETGCGKSMICNSIVGLLPGKGQIVEGSRIVYKGEDLLSKTDKEMAEIRGKEISMMLQDSLASLNPVYTIGNQIGESLRLDNVSTKDIRQKAIALLESLNVSNDGDRLGSYPFQFSGGMRQRTSAAIAIARSPKLLIADEPTSYLDIKQKHQFMSLLRKIQQKNGMAILLVTHDLSVIAESCDRANIMYAGKTIETGTVGRLFEEPIHPYTEGLVNASRQKGLTGNRFFQLNGEPPNLMKLPKGCSFHPRCQKSMPICREKYPPSITIGKNETAACWLLKS